MNIKRFLMAIVGVFVSVFAFDFVVHGIFLSDTYSQTPHLWRPMAEHNMMYMYLSQIFFSVAVVFMFTKHFEGKGIGEGARFGTYLGLILASIQIGTYCYMPISLCLTASWVVAAFVKSVMSGVIASLVYKN